MSDDIEKGEKIELNHENMSNENTQGKHKDDENVKFYHTKIAELENKIKEISREKNMNEAIVFSLIEQKEVLNEQLSSVILEVAERNKEISDLERTMNMDDSNVNLLSTDRKNLIKNDEKEEEDGEEEDKMIFKQLELIMSEKSDSLLKYNVSSDKNDEYIVYEKLICISVLVIYADLHNSSSAFYLQNFTLNKHSVFKELKKTSCEFWDIDDQEYTIKFCNSQYKLIDIPSLQLNIDNFLKNQDNCKNAIMILFPEEKQVNTEKLKLFLNQRISLSDSKKTKNNIEIEDSVSEFFRRFVGLFTYMLGKLESIIRFLIVEGDESKLDEKKPKIGIGLKTYKVMLILVHLVFVFFFLDSLSITSPAKMYSINDGISNYFNSHKTLVFNRKSSIFDDISLKLNNFFLNDQGKKEGLLENFILVTPMRINFYKTNFKTCESFFQENVTCNIFAWDETTKNISRINYPSKSVQIPSGIYILKDKKYNNKLESPLKDESIIRNYISDSISNLTLNINNQSIYSIKGFMSTYTGNTYTMFVNSLDMNFNTFYLLLLNTKQTNIFDAGLRSIIVILFFMHPQTNRFIYIYLLYEINTDGCVLGLKYYNKIFTMNIYFGVDGEKLYIKDIIRLSLCGVILLSTLVEWFLRKSKFDKKNTSSFGNLMAIFVQPILLTNYIMFSLNLFSFLVKFKCLQYDYTNISNIYKGNVTQSFESDLYNSLGWFELVNNIESGLIFAVMVKFVMLFAEIDSIRVLILYIKNSSYKLGFYIFFLFFILLGFSTLSNNLWGTVDQRFVDLMGSLSNVLMNSIGHITIIENGYDGWNFVYIILFFSFFIYFLINTFVGLFLEVYRISTIRKGHLAEREKEMLIMFDVDEIGGLTKNLMNKIHKGLNKIGEEIKKNTPDMK